MTADDTAALDTAALHDLIARATEADGVPPFSDGALVAYAKGERELVWERDEQGNRVAAALDSKDAAEFVVDPAHRGHGYGSRMLDMLTHPARGGHGTAKRFWAHGDSAAAKAMMDHHKLEPFREVLHLRAPVVPPLGDAVLPALTDADIDDLIALNARAFAHHAEQGGLTREDFEVLRGEPWFSMDDVLLSRDDSGTLTGFVWLKVVDGASAERSGEFYVVGVAPERQGAGEGRRLMNAGFARLATSGIQTSHLYVDSNNVSALALYLSLGFERISSDLQYHYIQ